MKKPVKFEITAQEFEQNMIDLDKAGINPWHQELFVIYDRENVEWIIKNKKLYNYFLFTYQDDKKIINLDKGWLTAFLAETMSDIEKFKNFTDYNDIELVKSLIKKKEIIEEQLKNLE